MRAILHIGFHKTGTTSIQAFLNSHRDLLHREGVAFFKGGHIPDNHVELHTCALRDERMTPFKMMYGAPITSDYRSTIARDLEAFRENAVAHTLLFSAEGLSYLRFADEFHRLRELIGISDISIIAYVRESKAWLESYAAEMEKNRIPATADCNSFAYVDANTWLVNFKERLVPFGREFGAGNVTVLNYDDVCSADGGVIPSFLRTLGVSDAFDISEANKLRLNVRAPIDQAN